MEKALFCRRFNVAALKHLQYSIPNYGLDELRQGLSENRAMPVHDYSWMDHSRGFLWTGFSDKELLYSARDELIGGQRMFYDWNLSDVIALEYEGLNLLGFKVWKYPRKTSSGYLNGSEQLTYRGLFSPAKFEGYKLKQDNCVGALLHLSRKGNPFSGLMDMAPARNGLGCYSLNVAHAWKWILDQLFSESQYESTVAEILPRMQKGSSGSSVMLALATSGFFGTYVPLDNNEHRISSLFRSYQSCQARGKMRFKFKDMGPTEWTSMNPEVEGSLDVLFASRIIQEFAFAWHFHDRQEHQHWHRGFEGYNTSPYDELSKHPQRARVHWLRMMDDYVNDRRFYGRFRNDLDSAVGQIGDSLKDLGFVAAWHYPDYSLLLNGLTEQVFFEMQLYSDALELMKENGLVESEIRLANQFEALPFHSAIRVLKKCHSYAENI